MKLQSMKIKIGQSSSDGCVLDDIVKLLEQRQQLLLKMAHTGKGNLSLSLFLMLQLIWFSIACSWARFQPTQVFQILF